MQQVHVATRSSLLLFRDELYSLGSDTLHSHLFDLTIDGEGNKIARNPFSGGIDDEESVPLQQRLLLTLSLCAVYSPVEEPLKCATVRCVESSHGLHHGVRVFQVFKRNNRLSSRRTD